MTKDVAISVKNLSKCYHIYEKPSDRLKQMLFRGRKEFYREFWAVNNVSFDVEKGDAIGILGGNGSGKSTLLQMICGTLNPTSGSVKVNGRVSALLELGSGFNPEFTGKENVYLNASILGLTEDEIDDRYNEILQFADIGDFIHQPVKTFSSGMALRLAFAVSVCVDPDILIIDEALAVGDMSFQFKCLERLKRITSNGTSLLFVSHDLISIKNFCNKAIYIDQGAVKALGSPSDISELYMLEMRNQTRYSDQVDEKYILKPSLSKGQGISFGTSEGKIDYAAFSKSNSNFAKFSHGEEIRVHIKSSVIATLPNPSISLIVHDARMINIGGAFFPAKCRAVSDDWKEISMFMDWAARFSVGRYYITVRLENRDSCGVFRPIDKQVAVMSFDVIEDESSFIGPVQLEIKANFEF